MKDDSQATTQDTPNFDNLDFTDPTALRAALGYDTEAQAQGAQPQGDTASVETAPVAQSAAEVSETPAADAKDGQKIAGVLTRDGKSVIPYTALQETRREKVLAQQRAKELETKNQELERQLEELRAGKKPEAEDGQYSKQELDELATDFPQLKPLLDRVSALQTQLEASTPKAEPAKEPTAEEIADAEVETQALFDEAMSQRPLLSKWQQQGGIVWSRAVEVDAQIMATEPNLSFQDRLAKVEKQLADELGVSVPTPPPAKAPKPAPIPQQVMPTLTDFGGTGVPVGDPFAGKTGAQMVDAALSMSEQELRAMAGLSY